MGIPLPGAGSDQDHVLGEGPVEVQIRSHLEPTARLDGPQGDNSPTVPMNV